MQNSRVEWDNLYFFPKLKNLYTIQYMLTALVEFIPLFIFFPLFQRTLRHPQVEYDKLNRINMTLSSSFKAMLSLPYTSAFIF